ncbi:MAG TPA: hypothetical protein VF603_08780 [Allosphingosinicella sp.]|jgi:hypothetical protein
MSPGLTFAVIIFSVGALLLLGWLYATAGNARSIPMLGTSILFFVMPIMFAPVGLLSFALGMWALVAFEEGLKALASQREQARINRFWLVALFGIWELTVDKPFWGFAVAQSGESWDRLALVGWVYATSLPVLMHIVTAAIYAFAFREKRLWAAFLASWLLHMTFNEAVGHFGVSPAAALIETVVLASILAFLLRKAKLSTTASDC